MLQHSQMLDCIIPQLYEQHPTLLVQYSFPRIYRNLTCLSVLLREKSENIKGYKNNIEYSLCDKYCSKHSACIISFNPYNDPLRQKVIFKIVLYHISRKQQHGKVKPFVFIRILGFEPRHQICDPLLISPHYPASQH